MADYKVTDTEMISVANAIRAKGGTSAQLEWPIGFANAVAAIPSGGSATLIEKSITQNGTYNASSDNADGYSKVVVNVSGGSGSYFERIEPLHFDLDNGGFISSGTWNTSGGIGSKTDVYEVQQDKKYICMLGANIGNRFRCAFFREDPAEAQSSIYGSSIGSDSSSPHAYGIAVAINSGNYFPYTATDNGYIAIGKCNDNTSGIQSYLFEVKF